MLLWIKNHWLIHSFMASWFWHTSSRPTEAFIILQKKKTIILWYGHTFLSRYRVFHKRIHWVKDAMESPLTKLNQVLEALTKGDRDSMDMRLWNTLYLERNVYPWIFRVGFSPYVYPAQDDCFFLEGSCPLSWLEAGWSKKKSLFCFFIIHCNWWARGMCFTLFLDIDCTLSPIIHIPQMHQLSKGCYGVSIDKIESSLWRSLPQVTKSPTDVSVFIPWLVVGRNPSHMQY